MSRSRSLKHASDIPEVIAHRGYQRAYPENSLSAILAAIGCGARFVEVDVHLTADRTPVLLHDETLPRICGVDGRIHEVRDERLAELRAWEPGRLGDRFSQEPVARLEACRDLLPASQDVTLFVELKEAAARAFGEQAVVERVIGVMGPMLDRCVMISFSAELLREARRQGGCAIGPVVRTWKARGVVNEFDRRPDFLFCDIRGLPREGALSVEGVNLAVYEVPDADTARVLHARGVGYVETFGVCEMLAELGRPG